MTTTTNIFAVNEMIVSTLATVTIKPGFKLVHIPRFEGDKIEIRDEAGSLVWRKNAYESEFEWEFKKAVEYYFTPKSADEIKAHQDAARANQLRIEALCHMEGSMPHDPALSMFSLAEIEAEIAVIRDDLAKADIYTPRGVLVTTRGGFTLYAHFADVKLDVDGTISGVWDARHNLIHNPHMQYAVKPADVKAIDYV